MKKILQRHLQLNLAAKRSAFLWGPRRVGKSYWLRHTYPDYPKIDLLQSDVFLDYSARPALLRERLIKAAKPIIIDEIQKIPMLLDEVHWLIENRGISFILTGSSARKLKRGQANLLAGRALRYEMTPLTYLEVTGFDIEDVMISGMLPPFYLSDDPHQELRSYVGDYLREEIIAEARIQNIPSFSDFLRLAALTSGELINYTNIGREAGIKTKIVREYFQILEDTLLGFRISPWSKKQNRRMIETDKFYLFDVGLSNFLIQRQPKMGTPEFGKSFEHFVLMELRAYKAYKLPDLTISFWRTTTGLEVDFILGDMQTAIEIKASKRVHETDLKILKILKQEYRVKKAILVCFETMPRQIDAIDILPWKIFIEKLWRGELVS